MVHQIVIECSEPHCKYGPMHWRGETTYQTGNQIGIKPFEEKAGQPPWWAASFSRRSGNLSLVAKAAIIDRRGSREIEITKEYCI